MKFAILLFSVISLFGPPFGANCIMGPNVYDPSFHIPLKVWVVLYTGESIGGKSNFGCRTPLSEMRLRIKHLQDHSNLYGPNVVFDWLSSKTPTIIVDSGIDTLDRWRDTTSFFLQQVTNNWEPDHLNIYFVGNVQPNQADPDDVIAGTSDPKATCDLGGGGPPCLYNQHMIFMNDTGFASGFGFHAILTPDKYTKMNILEHEVTHFFARWNGVGIYTAGEHTTASNNILRSGLDPDAPIKLPLHIPGSFGTAGTDRYKIWDRIRTTAPDGTQNWLLP